MGAPAGNQGIYKITSPSNRIYIGQSIDLKTRFSKYRLKHCAGQKRLYNSFNKYGVENHKFEVIEYCEENVINERERYWQDFYDVLGCNGLNCKLQCTKEKKGRHSEQTKKKISLSNKGKKHSEEWKKQQSERKKLMSEETKHKIRLANLGKKASEESKEKNRIRMIGNTYTKGIVPVNARKVIDTKTLQVFESVTIAAKNIGVKPRTLTAWLDGQNKNKSSLMFL